MLSAKWIWTGQEGRHRYNQTIVARKAFSVTETRRAVEQRALLRITADSAYRCFINDSWVNDGPCRAWPEHYQYDEIDVTGYLHTGDNEIRIIAKYWGTGTFHQVPRQAGLLVQLDLTAADGDVTTVATDGSWEAAVCPAWRVNTPKVSIQMEAQEDYDARLEEALAFAPAAVLYTAGEGPWQDLHPRDVSLLTKKPFSFHTMLGANVVARRDDLHFCLPAARLAHPDLVEANRNTMMAGGMATVLSVEEPASVRFATEGMQVTIDGQAVDTAPYPVTPGDHLLVAFVSDAVGHIKEKTLRIVNPPAGLHLANPADSASSASSANSASLPSPQGSPDPKGPPNPQDSLSPWCYIAFPEFNYAGDDIRWPPQGHIEQLAEQLEAYHSCISALGEAATGVAAFAATLGDRTKILSADEMFVADTHWRFLTREKLSGPGDLIENPAGLLYDNAEVTVVHPSTDGDMELVLDLGEQNIGYYDLELIAEAGVEIDIYGVEYITPDGTIQHTWGNRNGMRYITREGLNRFTSFKRRSGRYIFVTLRNQHAPVRIRKLQLIESTYPVNAKGTFRCSDETLTRIWDISARTLKLCMEDTFTDCPLYEQTLWVGDARNESVFAYPVFGATDIGKRCATLAAQSLERYPIVGCQVPSGWDVLLPAWSFLWGISIWDYYEFTGDASFVKAMWPAVIRNLEGAAALRDAEYGLFQGPFWNMFDWSGIDDNHEIVLHNSMLFVGAVNAAIECAKVLHDADRLAWLEELQDELRRSINRLWDPKTRSYPDSIHEDGTISTSTSQHTSFLALLYDILPEAHIAHALANMLQPPEAMIRVGSPFVVLTYYEALEKAGLPDEIIASIRKAYTPMLEAGATTVWEIFSDGVFSPGEFPTRSHCHAWSSAPVIYLNRLILGIASAEPAGRTYEISPRLDGLDWASGTVVTARGPLHVACRSDGATLDIQVAAPRGTKVRYVENDTHRDVKVTFTVRAAH